MVASEALPPPWPFTDILKSSTFVGMADCRRALLQAGTRLYLADLTALSRDMANQQVLRQAGQAPSCL